MKCLPASVALAFGLWSGCSTPSQMFTGADRQGAETTVVFSRASGAYIRPRNPDGTPAAQTYALKLGGNFGGPRYDRSIDRVDGQMVARIVAAALAEQNYRPGDDPAGTDLAIIVYWGTTIVPRDVNPVNQRTSGALAEQASLIGADAPGASAVDTDQRNRLRAQQAEMARLEANIDAMTNARSANLLGYTGEIQRLRPTDPKLATLREEVEQNRYYVVLLAYDYREAAHAPRPQLLWETRFSIPERGNDFGRSLPMMASIAAPYFGHDSPGLARHRLGEGHVHVGDVKAIEPAP